MSTKPNHRRGEDRTQDHGSAWEGSPNDGGEGVRKGRAKWASVLAPAARAQRAPDR